MSHVKVSVRNLCPIPYILHVTQSTMLSQEMEFMLAGHSAVLVGGAKMIVIGGVRTGQHISPYVLQYDLSTDIWEILNTGALGPVGEGQYTCTI